MTMDALAIPLSILLGLLIGSFLNVCIYRIPRDLSVVAPRSFCPECGTQLQWFENVPLLSYFLQRRRCRHCGQPISLRYPAVEAATAALFLGSYLKWGVSGQSLKWIIFGACLIVLSCTDLEERLLPDEMTLGGAIAGLLFAIVLPGPGGLASALLPITASIRLQSVVNAVLGAMLLSLPLWLVGSIWSRVRRREALGFGDVKLLAMLGCFLGPGKGLLAVTLGAVTGAISGLLVIFLTRKDARTYELPFGSFLCAGGLAMAFLPAAERLALAVL